MSLKYTNIFSCKTLQNLALPQFVERQFVELQFVEQQFVELQFVELQLIELQFVKRPSSSNVERRTFVRTLI
jgi:hypothetical protein